MGRLASLSIPCPPLETQLEFERAVLEISAIEEIINQSNKTAKNLLSSLSAHAFSGQLTAEWREANRDKLTFEARQRDAALREAGGVRGISSKVRMQAEIEAMLEGPTEGIYSDLNREQRGLLRDIKRMVGGVRYARYFTAEKLSQYISTGPMRRNPQGVEGHLAVLAARGLIIPASREEQTEDTGKFVFGNAYRLPLHDFEPGESEEGEPQIGDHARTRELERLGARLEKESTLA